MNKYLWAKKSQKPSGYYWLPLYQHLEDTKNIIELLWDHWLSPNQREIVDESLDEDNKGSGKNLACFLAATHDIGKASFVFQSKRIGSVYSGLENEILEKLERSGFTSIYSSYDKLSFPEKSHHSIAGQYILHTYGVKDDISAIIGGHHGKPIDNNKICSSQSNYESNLYQYSEKLLDDEDKKNVYNKWKLNQKNILDWSLNISGFKTVNSLPKIRQPGQVILSGLLIMADWIASNEEYFPLFGIDDYKCKNPNLRKQNGYSKWEKTNLWNYENSFEYEELYKMRFCFEPNEVQKELSKEIDDSFEPGVFILEAPMGIGKTEAALIGAEQLAEKLGMGGIYFGLPTQATSDSIFPRILSWLEDIQKTNEENMQIRLVHGNAELNEDFLTLASSINQDDNNDSAIIVNHWFSGKKTSALDDFVVGTIDYFLMVALKQKHLALRHLGFSKKVIIIDEVHAYDSYMNRYLMEAIEWMGAYRVPIIILSATLPAEIRIKILTAYLKGRGKKITRKNARELEENTYTLSYPLISYTDGDEIKQVKDIYIDNLSKKNINIIKISEDDLLEKVEYMIDEGGIVGIIVNTVKRAQEFGEIFVEKFGDELVEILHSNFISTDRAIKEKKLLSEIGKGAKRPYKKIIIGTQVIEQSLDINFDIMVSDLAPMDLLIQRMGRLHRHDIKRPKKLKDPNFFVLGTSEEFDFNKGSKYVYGDYLLIRTQYFLPDIVSLPEDISTLVQNTYLNNDIEVDMVDFYNKAKEKYFNKIKNKQTKADTYKLASPILKESPLRKENMIGWLKNTTGDKSEVKSVAQVRDIDQTLEVIALKKIGEGYGTYQNNKDISFGIGDFDVDRNLCKNTLRLPRVLSLANKIDETIDYLEDFRMKKLSSWNNSFWLKGSLGIIFDENNEFHIFQYLLRYDEKFGLYLIDKEE